MIRTMTKHDANGREQPQIMRFYPIYQIIHLHQRLIPLKGKTNIGRGDKLAHCPGMLHIVALSQRSENDDECWQEVKVLGTNGKQSDLLECLQQGGPQCQVKLVFWDAPFLVQSIKGGSEIRL